MESLASLVIYMLLLAKGLLLKPYIFCISFYKVLSFEEATECAFRKFINIYIDQTCDSP